MPTPVFYPFFERHAHGEGANAHSTTYCPGCGHGLAQKYLAQAIEELGVQDRTVLVSPVGCSVFMYYYFDVGNTQAAHGRAPAVAMGHKMANPSSVVVAYQGDGDLASIGLAEIISTAQLGIPITVIFMNNAVFGMTGGQMAPTTLIGQRTTTTPRGRPLFAGQPLKMAELVSGLDGPVYVERVALFDNKQKGLCQARHQKSARNTTHRQGVCLFGGPLRMPGPSRAGARSGRALGQGQHGPGVPPGGEEGHHRRGRLPPHPVLVVRAGNDAQRPGGADRERGSLRRRFPHPHRP